MKTIFTKFAAASLMLAAVACQNEDMLDGGAQNGTSVERVPLTITATLENGQTKTALQEGGKVYWENGDAMTVLAVGEDATVTSYKFTTADEGAEATFTNENEVPLAPNYYAVYPHTDKDRLPYLNSTSYSSWICSVVDSKLKVYFPSMQKVSQSGTEGLDAYSVGVVAEDGTVAMKNLGGLIKINIPVDDIEHVILYANAEEDIVGNAYVTFGEDGLPAISSVDGSNMVRIVPASGKTFGIGEYYINVLPVTFSNGFTIIFTKSDNTWASVRSSGEFVVERSKISPVPEISNLKFGGKVVDILSVNESTGKAAQPFTKGPNNEYSVPPSSNGFAKTLCEYVLAEGGYKVNIYGTAGHSKTTSMGFQFGKAAGDYIEVPGIEGYALNKVVVRIAANGDGAGSPEIQTTGGDKLEGCGVWAEPAKPFGIEYAWSFSGDAETPYRIVRTTAENKYTPFQQIRLYYADAPEGESSIKPLITSVTTAEAKTDPINGKVTLNGSFTAVDCNSSAVTCGFDYKLVSEQEWTSVSCPQATSEFSYELTASSSEDYVYRAWTKVNATGKTVYGSEVQFNPCKLVLRLVFDDNHYTNEDGWNFLLREWHWGTNTNTATENPNGATYNYTYEGVDYPFTFWSYRPSDTEGGYSLWVASGSKKVYGLSLSYATGLADSQPAWMLMPGPKGFKLVEVDATLSNADFKGFGGTISVSVNEDGTASGDPVATYTGKSSFPLSLEGTEAGKPYYFCTTHNNRPTLKDLTLTYLYVGE